LDLIPSFPVVDEFDIDKIITIGPWKGVSASPILPDRIHGGWRESDSGVSISASISTLKDLNEANVTFATEDLPYLQGLEINWSNVFDLYRQLVPALPGFVVP